MNLLTPPARVAFIGMGVMGAAMAANIARAGFALTVTTRSQGRAQPLLDAGAQWAATAAEAARGAACVALCVPDTPDVEAVLFGPGGVAETVAPGTLVIDFSTIAAGAAAGFASRLAAQGVAMLDSPVSGGPQGAIEAAIRQVMEANADKLAEYRSGKDKLFGFFVGQVMKAMAGKGNPAAVNDLLKTMLAP